MAKKNAKVKAKAVKKTKTAAKPSKKVVKKAIAKPKKAAKPSKKEVKKVVTKSKTSSKASKKVVKKVQATPKKEVKPIAKANKLAPVSKSPKVETKTKISMAPPPVKRKKKDESRPESVGNVDFGRQIKPSMVAPKFKIAAHDPNKTRYSDKELAEFKKLIDEKMEAAKNELRYLQDQINRKDDNGTDDTENKFASMEDGSASSEREYLTQMAARQLQYIDHLDKALMRIFNKTYGICRVTGKLIDKDRLRAVPHATLSMEAKLIQNK